MTYYLMKWEENYDSLYAPGHYVLDGSVGTLEEVERWAAQVYQTQRDENHKPFAIEGERMDFRFSETMTAVSSGMRIPREQRKKRK